MIASVKSSHIPSMILLIGASLWGIVWWPLKYFDQNGITDAVLILYAYGFVTALTLPLLWRERHQWREQRGLLLLLALLGGYANLSFVTALSTGEVVRVTMLFYLAPVWGVLGGRIFLGEQISRQRAIAVTLALTGASILLFKPGILSSGPSWTDLLALSSGMAFAANNVTCRAAQKIPVTSKAVIVFAGCTVLAAITVGYRDIPTPDLPSDIFIQLAVFALLFLLLATLATQYGVTHMEAGRASILLMMELVVALLSAVLIGGETLDIQAATGGMLILAAAILDARNPEQGRAEPVAPVPGTQPGGPG